MIDLSLITGTTLLDGEPVPYFQAQFWPTTTNVALLPSTTFPVMMGSSSHMPIALNVVGPEYSDLKCIDMARLLKVECGCGFVPPPLAATAGDAKL